MKKLNKLLEKHQFNSKFSLIKRINKNLEKKANPYYGPNYKPKPSIKPSELGTPCPRKLFYSFLKVPKDRKLKADIKRIFDTGEAIHHMKRSWLQDLAAEDPLLYIEYKDPQTGEVPINKWSKKPDPEFPLTVEELEIRQAKIDGLGIINGKLWIYEFKSMKAEKFQKLKDVLPEHKEQAGTYVHLVEYCLHRGDFKHIKELEGITEVAGVIYLYLNKNDSDLKEFIVEKDESTLDPIVEKILKNRDYVNRKELPPCERCDYFCDWKRKCARNYNPLTEEDTQVS